MPNMRWDHASDQQLMVCIFQAHGMIEDWEKVASEWPVDAPIRPTPRAIREHIQKLRDQVKAAGATGVVGGTNEGGAKRKGRPAKSAASPEKRSRTAAKAILPKSKSLLFVKHDDSTEEEPQAEEEHRTEDQHQGEEGEA